MINDEEKHGFPIQPLLGLTLGAISGVIHPGLFYLLFPTWIIPALIAGLLSLSPKTRGMALGFGAASLGWLAFSVTLFVYGLIGSAFR